MATSAISIGPGTNKRKFEDGMQSPGAGSSTADAAKSSSAAVAASDGAQKPKKKKIKTSKDQAEVFAFNSADLRSRQRPVSIAVCAFPVVL